jgi:hypothetical protein
MEIQASERATPQSAALPASGMGGAEYEQWRCTLMEMRREKAESR